MRLCTQESTYYPGYRVIKANNTLATPAQRSELSMVSPEQAAQFFDAERRHRPERLDSLLWNSSPQEPMAPDLFGSVPVVEEFEEDYIQELLFLVCLLIALILLSGVLLLRFLFMTARPTKQVHPLVCTVSTKFHRTDSLPHDGLCDYLFYDSLYKGGNNSLARTLSFDVEAFVAHARRHTFTEFGMSFAIE
ncbi:hypothetical protein HPB51_027842 [Rhipicephalus microplus]|uniref:Uncharacterized protein n=1 Tax=Rhipicephalus microplus TaxID=6941 RepID=A0A9J6CZ65_RHIMP|nr:hypothetical protein HPB51_027842 [Rhipicephalus microplus]